LSAPAATLPQIPIGGLAVGASVDSVYHLVSLEQRTKKNGDPYFMMQLGDATGTAGAVMWDGHHAIIGGLVREDDFVRVRADAGMFNNNLQLTLKSISRVEDSEVDLAAFLPVSPRDRATMEAELDEWIARVKDGDCRRLLARFFENRRLREMYCTAPAAAKIHQAYRHGLLEHTLNVVRLATSIAAIYEPINHDILITGGLLHDIGKIRELDWRRTIRYTTEGRLMGHIPMGASMVDAVVAQLRRSDEGFSEATHHHIVHLILSHHGKLEWGSPVRPATREAMVLHYADNTEAYMTVFAAETAKAAAKGEAWTPFNRMFDAYLYAGAMPRDGALASEEVNPRFRTSPIEHPDDTVPPRP
jgi:3'-5' exoribonuclease